MYKILFYQLVYNLSVNKSAIRLSNNRAESGIDFRHRGTSRDIGWSGSLALQSNQSGTGDRTSGFSVFAWHAASKPGRNVGLYPFILGSSRRNRIYQREACQLYRVLCNCHHCYVVQISPLPFSAVICARPR